MSTQDTTLSISQGDMFVCVCVCVSVCPCVRERERKGFYKRVEKSHWENFTCLKQIPCIPVNGTRIKPLTRNLTLVIVVHSLSHSWSPFNQPLISLSLPFGESLLSECINGNAVKAQLWVAQSKDQRSYSRERTWDRTNLS